MLTLPGYLIGDLVHSGPRAMVVHATREADGAVVVLKTSSSAHPTTAQVRRMEMEHAIGRRVRHPGLVKVLGLERHEHRPVLVLEDGGTSLDKLDGPLSLEGFLDLAVQVVDAVGALHVAGVAHRDINPSNIVRVPETGIARVCDFGIASMLSREDMRVSDAARPEGTLRYVSPEQTGRMNRSVDYRTDFYSLGATFFELLCGEAPFTASNPMELVHCHIARRPPDPCDRMPELPRALADIVLKLLSKTPEERYQTAQALGADLRECRRQQLEEGVIGALEIGVRDRVARFEIPDKLYGREAERAVLMEAFETAAAGSTQLVLIRGYAGIGKSSLVQEMYGPVLRQRAWFATGKFEQLSQHIPHYALLQAFNELVLQLVTEDDQTLLKHRDRIAELVGPDAGALAEVSPAIGVLLGPQGVVPQLPAAEGKARFNRAILQFVFSFTRPGAPLVLFLDNMQWADAASLRLIQHLLAADGAQNLLLIGAYREEEVPPGRPLALFLRDGATRVDWPVHFVTLGGLGVEQVAAMVADALHRPVGDVAPLARVLCDKTLGNPFFVRQYLAALHRDGLMRFEDATGTWTWDVAQIAAREMADNVVDLLLTKLRGLSDEAQRLLRLAACIGSQFDLSTLAVIAQSTVLEIAETLLETVNEGLVLPVGDAFGQTIARGKAPADSKSEAIVCRFLHDRIQQAAFSLIADDEQQSVRLGLGRLLLDSLAQEDADRRVFEIVDHINAGIDLVEGADRVRFARLNLTAGTRARLATAYATARRYMERGIALLPADSWSSHYDIAFALHCGRLECACLGHEELDEIEHLATDLLDHARGDLDRAKVMTLRVEQLGSRGRPEAALQHGLGMLDRLGVRVRAGDADAAMVESWAQSRKLIAGRPLARAISEAPRSDDPRHCAAVELFLKLGSPMYSIRPELLSLGSLETTRLSLTHGNAPGSGMCYAAGGIEVAHEIGDYGAGYELGRAGVELAKRWGAMVGPSRLLWAAYTRWLRQPLIENIDIHRKGFRECLELGDFVFCSQHASMLSQTGIMAGVNLKTAWEQTEPYFNQLEHTDLEEVNVCRITQWFVDYLTADRPLSPEDAAQGDEERPVVEAMEAIPFPQGLHWYHLLKCRLLLFAGDPVGALRHAQISALTAPNDTYTPRDLEYCHALALAAACDEGTVAQRAGWRAELEEKRGSLNRWAEIIALDNFLHKATLVEAEVSRIAGDLDAAEMLYERAIVLAREYGFTHDEALASERAARFALGRELNDVARSHLRNACYCYDKWGARAKVLQLRSDHANLLSSGQEEGADGGSLVHAIGVGGRVVVNADPESLDLFSILKASQAISAEVMLETLLRRLLRTVIENAGAERGALLLESDGDLRIHAVSSMASDDVRILDSTPVSQTSLLSQGIVNYVVHMHEDVVLDEATAAGAFRTDPYVSRKHPRSVLCARIVGAGKLVGVVYLENNMASGAFTSQRLEIVRVLAAQAAISIQNAKLYDSLTQHSQEITRLREQLELENEYLREEVKTVQAFGNIVGTSAAVRKALDQVGMVAPTDASVLILGESGTGKELIAHAIHERSQRAKGPFITVNSASIPKELFESEFFGHVRGAFTGAVKDRVGRFQLADGGTLFLDEVGEIPLELQGKLLRVLQEGTFERVGEERTCRVDVRIVAATNRNLEAAVQAGAFRQDLYYRLSVFPIELAPLRNRSEDVPALVQLFMDQSASRLGVAVPRLTQRHVAQLMAYDWPGNVRELQNVVERALITSSLRGLSFDIPVTNPALLGPTRTPVSEQPPLAEAQQEQAPEVMTFADLKQLERQQITRALEQANWRISGKDGAAALLGTRPSTLASRIKAMGISRSAMSEPA